MLFAANPEQKKEFVRDEEQKLFDVQRDKNQQVVAAYSSTCTDASARLV
jgi:hypothetical protein